MYLVTGATGNVGAEVLAALRERGEPVRALARKADGADPEQVADEWVAAHAAQFD
jgi:uncharacterized protein YbjT (DUF2867 family)